MEKWFIKLLLALASLEIVVITRGIKLGAFTDSSTRWAYMTKMNINTTTTETTAQIWTGSLTMCLHACLGRTSCIGVIFSSNSYECLLQRRSSLNITQIAADSEFYMMESERNPASCSEIKECWPSSYDGEYWLYPKRFGRKSPVKVYCHNMSSPETAEEYVTLQRQNYFIGHDASHLISFARCTRNSLPVMRTEFSKVRINVESMSVVQEDFTFAMTTGNSSKVENVPFGTSSDCTAETWWEKRWGPCQLEGTFLIDLQDTGLSIAKSVGWVNGSADWFSEIRQFSRSADSTTVSCLVIGWCGNCLPNDTIILEPLTGAETTGTAQTVICD